MNPDVQRERQLFTSYEYKELNVKEEQASFIWIVTRTSGGNRMRIFRRRVRVIWWF